MCYNVYEHREMKGMVFLKRYISKESVGKVVLTVSSATAILLGSMLYDSNVELHDMERQLGKAQIIIGHQQSDYRQLEQKFTSVETESQKLSKRQRELMSQLEKYEKDNKSLLEKNKQIEGKNKSLKENVATLKKNKVSASRVKPYSVASSTTSVSHSHTEKTVVVSRGNSSNRKTVVFNASAYIALCDTGCTGVTAVGHDILKDGIHYDGHRIIAVDPNVIPLHSIVRVSYGDKSYTAIAMDTGGAIKGHKIDILVDSASEAIDFGRQNVSIEVLRSGR